MEVFPPKEEAVAARLIELLEDREAVVRKRFQSWNGQLSIIEEAFKTMLLNVQSDKAIDQVTEVICDAIQNPIF